MNDDAPAPGVNPLANDPDAQVGTVIRVAQAALLYVLRGRDAPSVLALLDAVQAWTESNPESAARLLEALEEEDEAC